MRTRVQPRTPAKPKVEEPTTYGATDLDYNAYLKVPQLLKLQVPLSKPSHHDEMLFIIIHQAYELWFKLILHELDTTIRLLRGGNVLEGRHALNRVVQVQRLLVQQIHLLETMRPVDFLKFRDQLKPASGFQSLQFREIEFVGGLKDEAYLGFFRNRPDMVGRLRQRAAEPDLRVAFYDALRAEGFKLPPDVAVREASGDARARGLLLAALREIFEKPARYPELYALSETMLDFDESFQLWREHHVRVVERIIGAKRGTGGSSGAAYLRSTVGKRFFPILWDVRTELGEPQ